MTGAAATRAPAGRGAALARRVAIGVLVLLAACGASAPASQPPRPRAAEPRPTGDVQRGIASWYGGKHHGGPTASGERYNKRALTAAHRTLKFHTRVRVTNERNGRSVIVRINDRGPFVKGRIIDVSEAAAEQLGIIRAGLAPVKVERLR